MIISSTLKQLSRVFRNLFLDPPTAVIAIDIVLLELYRYCKSHGIRIGKDIAVIACDNLTPHLVPRPSTITHSPENIVEKAWELMEYCLNGGRGPKITCPDLTILTGGSARPRVSDS